jgi:hypothetical protein
MNKPTPILDELRITVEGAVALFDSEANEDHPDPIDDAIELVREAEELLPAILEEHKELIASLRECVARLESLDDRLLKSTGSVKDSELGEITRARALLAKLKP